jgi:hypothetical protein
MAVLIANRHRAIGLLHVEIYRYFPSELILVGYVWDRKCPSDVDMDAQGQL